MSTLQEIESAIEQLPSSQKWDLLHRLQDRLSEDWDQQIEKDHEAGHLDFLISEVRAEISTGSTKPLNEILGNS